MDLLMNALSLRSSSLSLLDLALSTIELVQSCITVNAVIIAPP